MRKKTKRIYGILLSMSMLLTLLSVPVWAAEPVGTGAGYEQKQQQEHEQEQKQIQEKKQIQEQEGSAQNPEHEHTEDCYTLTKNCIHEHTTECYPQNAGTGTGTVSGNDVTETVEAQPTECTHVCSEESGCITKEWNCGYNGENNGAPATVEASQSTGTVEAAEQEAETVTVESVQAMIDALPDAEEISSDNVEEVAEQLEAIDRAKTKLSDEEIDTLDFSKYMKAAAALGELSVPMLTANGTGEVSTAEELTAALANSSIPKITLMSDITISSTLMVDRAVTLDLNGCVLKMTGSGSVIQIKASGLLLIEDGDQLKGHEFTSDEDGLWKLVENSTINIWTVLGGVITGGTGTQVPSYGSSKGGGVYIEPQGSLVMNGGSIVGCTADYGGGVYIDYDDSNKKYGAFIMSRGSIAGCKAQCGGGVDNDGKFVMTGGWIFDCTAKSDGGVRNYKLFIMSGGKIDDSNNNDKSYIANYSGSLTISDNAEIHANVSILNGSILNADGGVISGNVMNGDRDNGSGTITGSKGVAGSTRFSGSVTNNSDYRAHKSIIEKGTFTGSVTNNDGCMILGGDFSQATLSGNLEITFEPGNGDPDIIQKVVWKNNGEKLTEPSPVKENYTIEGWYYDDNGTEKKWDFNKDLVRYTMTLKAKWKPNTYTVNLEANGGTIANGKEVTDYTYGTDVTLPTKDDIIRKGYTFEGWWYTDTSFSGSPVTKISSTDGGNKTFYAKWKQNTTPVTPGKTEPKDTNHDNISHNNTDYYDTGDTNESSGTAPVRLIADDNEKTTGKDNSQFLIEDYKPGSTDTTEDMEDQTTGDQVTEEQATGDQSTEDTRNDQKSTAENSPADNDSKPDDSADLAPEKTSGNNPGILIVCAFAGAALIGILIYIIYKKGNKGRRL